MVGAIVCVQLRGPTPHGASVPCASGGCENTPQAARVKNNSNFGEMPEAEISVVLGALLIPAGCCLVERNCGRKRNDVHVLRWLEPTHVQVRSKKCVGANEVHVLFGAHNSSQRGSSQ